MTDDMLHVMKWHNGEKEYSPFSDAEMTRRQSDVRRWMAENDVDASGAVHLLSLHQLLLRIPCTATSAANTAWSSIRTMLRPSRPASTAVSRGVAASVTTSPIRTGAATTSTRPSASFTPGARRIGIEFDHVNLDFSPHAREEALPGVELVDVGQPSMWMRTIKSLEEQKLIREGARVCDVGGAACVAAVKAGVPSTRLRSPRPMRWSARSPSFPFVELMDTWTWFQSGINTDGAHNPVTNRIVQSGDILSLNTFPMIFGYYTALERTLFCDHVDDASLDPGEERRRAPPRPRTHQAGRALQGYRHRA